MNISKLVEQVRRSHNSLPWALPWHRQKKQMSWYLPWDWVEEHTTRFAEGYYEEMPHWHHWKAECIKSVPFELRMAAVGFWASIWYYEIMLRKARDRKSPITRERTEEYRRLLIETLNWIKNDIDTTRDLVAELAYEKAMKDFPPATKRRKITHFWNRLWWGH